MADPKASPHAPSDPPVKALADALRNWQRTLGRDLNTTYWIDFAEQPAVEIINDLRSMGFEIVRTDR